ncbi:hypothetical protein [Paenibacillus ginsengarvi]|uniref:Uncharacterized protein n=1 Tax=Paenibacillus ginsengarvi TaxID=400777 RepID=A0A3B0CK11_9BACL|nr:hypothetical protein [Paenibacillus ginsengarvi]RKN84619.1 hypothetical protein D7M11_11525 [Paenibacillus ginsengarvi]
MESRLTRTDYIFSLILVFMLVCVAGAFFFGFQIGQNRAEAEFLAKTTPKEEAAARPGAYDQQYLVSFYHTIYAPYREFTNRWFDKMKELELQNGVDASAVMKELSKSADEKYSALANAATSDTSPLLGEAHQNLVKSMKLFAQTTKQYQSKANAMKPGALIDEIDGDSYTREAKKLALQAQQQYYAAIVKWNETIEAEVKGVKLLGLPNLTAKDWSQMNLNVKNAAVSSIMLKDQRFGPQYPQDLTVRVDEMLSNGQAKKMNLNDIESIVNVLIDTNAARKGDYLSSKEKWYSGETIPQLPFFYENK